MKRTLFTTVAFIGMVSLFGLLAGCKNDPVSNSGITTVGLDGACDLTTKTCGTGLICSTSSVCKKANGVSCTSSGQCNSGRCDSVCF